MLSLIHIYLPFMRNAVGPMDYTPGAMFSMQPEVYRCERPNSASIGTRAYQMALFVIFESGLQMMADNPTLYYRNEECTQFITQVPQTWDETIALEAKAGEYAIVAKRKGDKWYIGGMTNNQQKERTFDLDFSFLKEGDVYKRQFPSTIRRGCSPSRVYPDQPITWASFKTVSYTHLIKKKFCRLKQNINPITI